MKKLFSLFLTAVMLVCFVPMKVLAEEGKQNGCPVEVINENQVVGMKVINGELYIEIVESKRSNSNDYELYYDLGRCKGKKKVVYGTISKSDLIKYRDKIKNTNAIWGAALGVLIGVATGNLGGFLASVIFGLFPDRIISAIDDALAHRNYPSKKTFRTKTTFSCEESNMGSRGWVHRYKLIGYYVY